MRIKSLFIFGIFVGLHFPFFARCNDSEQRCFHHIVSSFFKEMEHELDLSWGGNGVPTADKIDLGLIAHHSASIEEARALIVYTTEKLLKSVNSHEELRPYLKEYPFDIERIDMHIDFKNGLNNSYADGSVSHVSHRYDLLFYGEAEVFTHRRKELLVEPYEEAKKQVSLDQPPYHIPTEFETALEQVYLTFDELMCRKYNTYAHRIGCKKGETLDAFEAIYIVFQRSDYEKAREAQIYATETLLGVINSNERLRPFLKTYPFTAEQIKLRLEFRKHVAGLGPGSYADGTMESVMLENGELSYFKEEWEGELTHVVPAGREPYDEALRLVGKKKHLLVKNLFAL